MIKQWYLVEVADEVLELPQASEPSEEAFYTNDRMEAIDIVNGDVWKYEAVWLDE